jgi:hypothetical protein
MKKNDPSPDMIQYYLANEVVLHPTLKIIFDRQLYELESKGKLRLLPSTILIMYNRKLQQIA